MFDVGDTVLVCDTVRAIVTGRVGSKVLEVRSIGCKWFPAATALVYVDDCARIVNNADTPDALTDFDS